MAHDKTRRTKHADAAASLYPSHTRGAPVRKAGLTLPTTGITVPKTAPAGKVAAARLYPSSAQVKGAKVLANTP